MSVSIKKHFNFSGTQQEIELKRAFTAILTDLTAIKASIAATNAQLDADATVTDTDYNANDVGTLSLTS